LSLARRQAKRFDFFKQVIKFGAKAAIGAMVCRRSDSESPDTTSRNDS